MKLAEALRDRFHRLGPPVGVGRQVLRRRAALAASASSRSGVEDQHARARESSTKRGVRRILQRQRPSA